MQPSLTVDISLSAVHRAMTSPMLTRTVPDTGVAGTNSPSRLRSWKRRNSTANENNEYSSISGHLGVLITSGVVEMINNNNNNNCNTSIAPIAMKIQVQMRNKQNHLA